MNIFAPSTPKIIAPRAPRTLPPRWLMHMGALGLFFVSVIDASVIPLPIPGSTDLLLLFLVAHSGNPWILTPSAIVGSILGGYTTWHIGRRGGEVALRRYVPKRFRARILMWVEHHPILAVFLPAVLPPPIPLLPFALASGALQVPRNRFLVIFGAARTMRYAFVAWLGVVYGHAVARMFASTLQKWSAPLLYLFLVLLAGSLCFAVWQIRRHQKSEAAEDQAKRRAPRQVH